MKKLYSQFNDLNINEDVEPMNVSELEKERIKNKVTKRKIRRVPRIAAVAIIFASIIVGSLTMSIINPAFAKNVPIIGNIYELFKDTKFYIFDGYDEHASDIGITKESNGIAVTITGAVYDGSSITIAYTIKSDRHLGDEPVLVGLDVIEEYKNRYTPGRYMMEHIGEIEYAGLYIIHLMEGNQPDTVNMTWDGEQIEGFDLEEPIKGDWSFELTLDTLNNETVIYDDIFIEENGFKVDLTRITTSPVSTTLYFIQEVDKQLDGWETENWSAVDFRYLVSDNLGNEYKVNPNNAYGSSKYRMRSRITTTAIDEEATSITITPEVYIVELINGNTGGLVKKPYTIQSFEVPLE